MSTAQLLNAGLGDANSSGTNTFSDNSVTPTNAPLSDAQQFGTIVTTTAVPAVSFAPEDSAQQPNNMVDAPWTFQNFTNRWADMGAIRITPSTPVGVNVATYNLPHAALIQQSIKIPPQNFMFWRGKMHIRATMPTILSQQGIARLFFVPGSELDPSVFGMVNASYNQGVWIKFQSTKAVDLECSYNAPNSYMNTNTVGNTPDENVSIGQVNLVMFTPYRGCVTGTTISLQVKFVDAEWKIPRQIPLNLRMRFAEDDKHYPFVPSKATREQKEKYREIFHTMEDYATSQLYNNCEVRSIANPPSSEDDFQLVMKVMKSRPDLQSRFGALLNAEFDDGALFQDVMPGIATGQYRMKMDFLGSLLGFGGKGGNKVTYNNTYDARVTNSVAGNVSGGIRSETGRDGDQMDQRPSITDSHNSASSLSASAVIPAADKPDIGVIGQPRYLTSTQPTANVSGAPAVAVHMDWEAESQHKMSLVNLGTSADEMDVRSLIERESYGGSGPNPFFFSFDTTTVAGVHLLSIPITPCPQTFQTVSNADLEVSYLEYFSNAFAFWRGSLEYTIHISKNGFARGRIIAVTDFAALRGTPLGSQAIGKMNQYFINMDLSDETDVYKICVPYMSNFEAMRTSGTDAAGVAPAASAINFFRASTGWLRFYAMTNVTSMDCSTQTIDIFINISAGKDFVFVHPQVNNLFQPILPRTITKGVIDTGVMFRDSEPDDDEVIRPKMSMTNDPSSTASSSQGKMQSSTGNSQGSYFNRGSSNKSISGVLPGIVPSHEHPEYGRLFIQGADPPLQAGAVGFNQSGNLSGMVSALTDGAGIDQQVKPVDPNLLPADCITAASLPGPGVDMSTLFHVAPAYRTLRHFLKRMTPIHTVSMATVSIKSRVSAASQTVSFMAFPVCTGILEETASMFDHFVSQYNYVACDFNYCIKISYDTTDPINQGLIFKAVSLPMGISQIPVANRDGALQALGGAFMKFDPGERISCDQPAVFTSGLVQEMYIRMPFNNQMTYLRPSQLAGQDGLNLVYGITGPTFNFGPLIYKNLEGNTIFNHMYGDERASRYMSGIVLVGLCNSSVIDPTKIPNINVEVSMCPSDLVRVARLFQVPRLRRLSDFLLTPIYAPITTPFIKGVVNKKKPVIIGAQEKQK